MTLKALSVAGLLAWATPPLPAQALVVRHSDGREVRLAATELAVLPDTVFSAVDHGRPIQFRGVPLRTVLARAGVGPIDSLRGPALRRVLMLRGADGYSAAVALADLDASLGGKLAFVVTHENGTRLRPTHGPYRAIVLGDARASRWVRQLERLELIELP